MVAINVIRQEHFVHIVSDGAFCDNSGIVCEIGPKAFTLPHLPAALAIRGASHFMPFLVHRLSRECQSFDEALTRIAQTAREVYLSFPMAFGTLEYGAVEPDFDLVVVGWSRVRGRPESYLVSSHDRIVAREVTAKAWHLVELPDILIAPPVTEVALASPLLAPPPTSKELTFADWKARYSARPFRPGIDGVMLLNAQRRSPRELDPRLGLGSGPIYVVGGFIQVTSVSCQGTVSEVLCRWPDKVGGRIDPQASASG